MALTRLHEHASRVAVSYLVIVSLAVFLAQSFYRDYARSLVSLALTAEHSYLAALLVAVATAIYLSAGHTGLSRGVRLSRLLASLLGLLLSVALCIVSAQNTEYAVQIQGAGFSAAFVSIALLVHETRTPGQVLPFLTPFLLIPLPAAATDPVALALSRAVSRLAAFTGSIERVEFPHLLLGVQAPRGAHDLDVGYVCSGTFIIGSVLSVIPALAYMAASSGASSRRKLVVAVLSLAAGLGVGFAGSLAWALATMIAARGAGVEGALNAFHYNPSILYSATSAAISFYLVKRCTKTAQPKLPPTVERAQDTLWGYVLGALLVATVTTVSVYAAILPALPGNRATYTVSAGNLVEVFDNPLPVFGDRASHFAHSTRDELLARTLGALNAYRVEVEHEGEYYRGYVEVVDTPAKLRTWQLYLALQGFRVTSWSTSVDTRQLSYVLVERGSEEYVLAHTLIPVGVETPGYRTLVYVRVSLISPCRDRPAAISRVTSALLKLAPVEGAPGSSPYLSAYLVATHVVLAFLLAYLGIIGTGNFASRLRVKVRKRGARGEL